MADQKQRMKQQQQQQEQVRVMLSVNSDSAACVDVPLARMPNHSDACERAERDLIRCLHDAKIAREYHARAAKAMRACLMAEHTRRNDSTICEPQNDNNNLNTALATSSSRNYPNTRTLLPADRFSLAHQDLIAAEEMCALAWTVEGFQSLRKIQERHGEERMQLEEERLNERDRITRVQAEEMELLVAGRADADAIDLLISHHRRAITTHETLFVANMNHLLKRQCKDVSLLATTAREAALGNSNRSDLNTSTPTNNKVSSSIRARVVSAQVKAQPINTSDTDNGVFRNSSPKYCCVVGGIGFDKPLKQIIHDTAVLTLGLAGSAQDSQFCKSIEETSSLQQRFIGSARAKLDMFGSSVSGPQNGISWTNIIPQGLGYIPGGQTFEPTVTRLEATTSRQCADGSDLSALPLWCNRGRLLNHTTTDTVCVYVGSQRKVPVQFRVEVRPGPLLNVLLLPDIAIESKSLLLRRKSIATELSGRDEAYRRNWEKLFACDGSNSAMLLLPMEKSLDDLMISKPEKSNQISALFREVCAQAGREPHFAGLDHEEREYIMRGDESSEFGEPLADYNYAMDSSIPSECLSDLQLLITRHSVLDGVQNVLHVPVGLAGQQHRRAWLDLPVKNNNTRSAESIDNLNSTGQSTSKRSHKFVNALVPGVAEGLERALALALRSGVQEIILPLRIWVLGLQESIETHQVKPQQTEVGGGGVSYRKPLPPPRVEALMKAFKAALAKALQTCKSDVDGGLVSQLVVTVLCSSTAASVKDMDAFPEQVRRADKHIAKKVCALVAKVFM